jgi:hypothetical protein
MTKTKRRLSESERAERRQRDRERLHTAAEQLLSSEGWQRWVRVRSQAGLARLSLSNQLLVTLQRAGSHCLLGRGGVDLRSSGAGWAYGYGDQRTRVGAMAGLLGLVGLFVTGIDVGADAGLAA